jgi:hypothetical protein
LRAVRQLSASLLLGTVIFSAVNNPFWSLSALGVTEEAKDRSDRNMGNPGPHVPDTQAESRLQWSHYEVELALMECIRLVAVVAAEVVPVAPIRDGTCGTPAPVLLRSLGGMEKVVFEPPLLLNCPMVAALSRWLETTVQSAAREAFGSPVTQIVGSSYSCRTAYYRPDTRLSQHAFANAIDLPVFILANGQRVDIAKEWGATRRDLAVDKAKLALVIANQKAADRQTAKATLADFVQPNTKSTALPVPVKTSTIEKKSSNAEKKAKAPLPLADSLSTPEAKFWRRIHHGACELFSTVLGPEANEEHRNHLHLDRQERNSLNVCE